jgi:HEAT repeat protein
LTIFAICLAALLAALSVWLLLVAYVVLDRLRYDRLLTRMMRASGAGAAPAPPQRPLPLGAKRAFLYRILLDPDMPPALRDCIAHGLLAADGLPKTLRRAGASRGAAGRWRRIAAWEVLCRAGYPGLHGILEATLEQDDDALSLAAIGMLGAMRDAPAAALLIAALRTGRGAAHCISMQLGRFDSGVVAELLMPLLDEDRAGLRGHAISLLGQHPLADMDRRLAAFAGDPDPAVRKAVAQAMGDLGGAHALIVAAGLLHDREGYVRAHAVRALHRISLTRSIHLASLLAPYHADQDWWVRMAVHDALSGMLERGSRKVLQLGAGEEWKPGETGGVGRSLAAVAGGQS